jgi:hypothetical protein
MNVIVSNPTAAGSSIINTDAASTTGMNIYTPADGRGRSRNVLSHSQKNIESAVYGHIRAVRALGRTTVDSHGIARALGLSPAAVTQALQNLADKGVKIVG